jgi:hypothetical protein
MAVNSAMELKLGFSCLIPVPLEFQVHCTLRSRRTEPVEGRFGLPTALLHARGKDRARQLGNLEAQIQRQQRHSVPLQTQPRTHQLLHPTPKISVVVPYNSGLPKH